MKEDQLSELSFEEKLKVTQFLIADIASQILSEDEAVVEKARHHIGALAMTFTNMHQLILKSVQTNNLDTVRSIYNKYRHKTVVDSSDSQ